MLLAPSALPAKSNAPPARVTTLDNGLRVVVQNYPHFPFVGMTLRYSTGYRNDPDGKSGLTALLWNMMHDRPAHLHGTDYYEFVGRAGIRFTASYTRVDDAIDTALAPANRMETLFWTWSDMMGFFPTVVNDQHIRDRREMVKADVRSKTDNSSCGHCFEFLVQQLFAAPHDYHNSTFADVVELESISASDVTTYHQQRFGPSRAVLTVVGSVDVDTALAMARRYFGPIPGSTTPTAPRPPDVPLQGETRVQVAASVRHPRVIVGWRTPAWLQPGDAALDVLAYCLTGLNSSLLTWDLIDRQRIARRVRARQSSRVLGSYFYVDVTGVDGVSSDALLAAIDASLARVTDERLSQVKWGAAAAEVMAPLARSMETLTGRSERLAKYEAILSDPEYYTTHLSRYGHMTRTEVAKLAHQTFGLNRVVLVVTPTPGAPLAGEVRSVTQRSPR
jgi:zinc protease